MKVFIGAGREVEVNRVGGGLVILENGKNVDSGTVRQIGVKIGKLVSDAVTKEFGAKEVPE